MRRLGVLMIAAVMALSVGCGTMMRGDLKDEMIPVYPATLMDGMMIVDAFSGRPVFLFATDSEANVVNDILACGWRHRALLGRI